MPTSARTRIIPDRHALSPRPPSFLKRPPASRVARADVGVVDLKLRATSCARLPSTSCRYRRCGLDGMGAVAYTFCAACVFLPPARTVDAGLCPLRYFAPHGRADVDFVLPLGTLCSERAHQRAPDLSRLLPLRL
ncbi:hypothetical protein C8J57DRAFT_1731853 [Mycena rebaudengoi]|nr:hypothetical protein C8J57DRAFT_1731853 [Mycena rebaudengoi]